MRSSVPAGDFGLVCDVLLQAMGAEGSEAHRRGAVQGTDPPVGRRGVAVHAACDRWRGFVGRGFVGRGFVVRGLIVRGHLFENNRSSVLTSCMLSGAVQWRSRLPSLLVPAASGRGRRDP